MYNIQSNSARFIYTLARTKKQIQKNTPLCLLKNNFYFIKETRSDEKIRFTETDLYAIIRTVLFIQVFQTSPEETLIDIINSGEVAHKGALKAHCLNLQTFVALVDSLFGIGFAAVASRVITKCYNEYCTNWKYYPYISKVKYPSASDYLNLARFVNVTSSDYGECEKFIIANASDHKIHLQQNKKILN